MTPDLQEAKRSLRESARRALGEVRPEDARAWSAAIARNILASRFFEVARVVMLFLPVRNEPDLSPVCRAVLAGGKRLCLPRVDWSAGTMSAGAVPDLDRGLVAGRMGLREPGPEAARVDPKELDLVVVPGLAFDLRGGRLGRGAGYYDRFLPGLSAATWGAAFELQLVPEIPMGAADMRVHGVVTERRTAPAADAGIPPPP